MIVRVMWRVLIYCFANLFGCYLIYKTGRDVYGEQKRGVDSNRVLEIENILSTKEIPLLPNCYREKRLAGRNQSPLLTRDLMMT